MPVQSAEEVSRVASKYRKFVMACRADRPEWKEITFLSDLVKSGDVHVNSDDAAKAVLLIITK